MTESPLCVPCADSEELSPADILRQAQELGAAAARRSEALDTQIHLTSSGAWDLPAPFMQAVVPACGDAQSAASGMLAAKDIQQCKLLAVFYLEHVQLIACGGGTHASLAACPFQIGSVLLAQTPWCRWTGPAFCCSHMEELIFL